MVAEPDKVVEYVIGVPEATCWEITVQLRLEVDDVTTKALDSLVVIVPLL